MFHGRCPTPTEYHYVRSKGHPLAPYGASVQEHRLILYDKIGPGSHPCHWCGKVVEWKVRKRTDTTNGSLMVDHLDENRKNNDPGNLVPSCTGCNAKRSDKRVIQPGELSVTCGKWKGRAVERLCTVCGKPFVRPLCWNRKKTKDPVCSQKCGGIRGQVRFQDKGWRYIPGVGAIRAAV